MSISGSIKTNEYCINSMDFYKVNEDGDVVTNADGSHKTFQIKELDYSDPKYALLLNSGINLNDDDMEEVLQTELEERES
jgi:hypothetical protein|tara:strand:- start:899 stop:1138 length:240 start_codon:yes stop_codon:yes gene_type:complete